MYVYFFQVPLFIAFYTFVEQTIFAKACVCMLMTCLSGLTCVLNQNILSNNPHSSGPLVEFTNQMLITYFVFDTLYHFWDKRMQFRRDLIFHHLLILTPFLLFPVSIGMTFPIMAEIYSTGALFGLSPRQNLFFRAVTILTIRLFIWTKLFRMSNIEPEMVIGNYVMRIVSTSMLGLDCYWLKQICDKLSRPPAGPLEMEAAVGAKKQGNETPRAG